MESIENILYPGFDDDETEMIDPVEPFAEQLEKIDIATYFCHNCTLEEMQKMKEKVIRNRKKEEKKKKELQEEIEKKELNAKME